MRLALQGLLTECMSNMGSKDRGDGLNRAIDSTKHKTREVQRQLRKAVAEQVSDFFVQTNAPLSRLIAAAKSADKKQVDQYSQVNILFIYLKVTR